MATPYQIGSLLPNYQSTSPGSEVSEKSVKEATNTGSCSLLPKLSAVSVDSSPTFVKPPTLNLADLKRQPRTFGKTRPQFLGLDSNWEPNPFVEMPQLTGSPCGLPPSPELSPKYHPKYEFNVIGPSSQLLLILIDLSEWKDQRAFIGAELVPVSPNALGTKPVSIATLKIPAPNSGVAIKAKSMLSSMNFVEQSTSLICYAGLIAIPLGWKSRDLVDL